MVALTVLKRWRRDKGFPRKFKQIIDSTYLNFFRDIYSVTLIDQKREAPHAKLFLTPKDY